MAREDLRSARWGLHRWFCDHGLHWPIRFDHGGYAVSYDPPEPADPGWRCDWCGEDRLPYRWPLWAVSDFLRRPVSYVQSRAWRAW